MKNRWILILAIVIGTILSSAPKFAEAATYKQCVKGKFGVGYVAKVKWYEAAKIKFTGTKIDLPTPSKKTKVAVSETECYSSSKLHFMTIEAIGNDTASTVVGVVAGVATGVVGIGLCAGLVVTPIAGAAEPCMELAIGAGEIAGQEVYAALPDPGIFFQGYAKEVELTGTVWVPKAKITKRLSGVREPNALVASCFGLKNSGTNDTLTIEFFEGQISLGSKTQVGCKPHFAIPSITHWSGSTPKMTHFTIATSGDDALWIDWLVLSGQWTGKIAEWGKAGGKGYCLSSDPADGKPWVKSNKVDKSCYKKFKFDVTSGKAYGFN